MENECFPFQLLAGAEVECNARTPLIERTKYNECTIEFIASGGGFLEINGKNFHPQSNGIYILTEGSDHRYWPDKDDPWYKIFFVARGELMHTLFRAHKLEEVYSIPNCPHLKKQFLSMIELARKGDSANREAALLFHRIVKELSDCVYGVGASHSPETKKLKEALDNCIEGEFNLKQYAEKSLYSETHLIRLFNAAEGMTPYDYLMSRKIEYAKRLLLYSTFPIREIAKRLAFSDQYYFSNYFKTKCGCSPRHFRNKFTETT